MAAKSMYAAAYALELILVVLGTVFFAVGGSGTYDMTYVTPGALMQGLAMVLFPWLTKEFVMDHVVNDGKLTEKLSDIHIVRSKARGRARMTAEQIKQDDEKHSLSATNLRSYLRFTVPLQLSALLFVYFIFVDALILGSSTNYHLVVIFVFLTAPLFVIWFLEEYTLLTHVLTRKTTAPA